MERLFRITSRQRDIYLAARFTNALLYLMRSEGSQGPVACKLGESGVAHVSDHKSIKCLT